MGFLDRAKEVAQRAKTQVRDARDQGQQRLEDLQARREAETLLREVGLAAFDEHRGDGTREAVVRALAALDQHLVEHPVDLATGGLRGYLKTASGSEATDGEATEDAGAEAETTDTGTTGTGDEAGTGTDTAADATGEPGPAAQDDAPKPDEGASATGGEGPAADGPVPDPDAPTPPEAGAKPKAE